MLATKLFLHATAFPLCKEMNNRWNRNCVSRGSCVILAILLPSSVINSNASSFHAPPVSTAIGTKWCFLAKSVFFCCFVCCRSVSRCCRSRRSVTNVRVSKCIWYGNVPRQWLAPRPWDLRRTVWSFAIRPRQTHCFLHCRVLRLLHRSPDDIVYLCVSDLPRRAFPARQAV